MTNAQQQRQLLKTMPQTVLARQLLLLSTFSLEQFLSSAILDNPLLELRFQHGNYECSYGATLSTWADTEDVSKPPVKHLPIIDEICNRQGTSLLNALLQQAGCLHLCDEKFKMLCYMIGFVDAAGYFKENLEALSVEMNTTYTEVELLLRTLQSFVPRGVGARDLSECLLLQIQPNEPNASLLSSIIRDDLQALAQHRFVALARKYHVDVSTVQQICSRIRLMNPKPGASYVTRETTPYIYPDASVRVVGNSIEWTVQGDPKQLIQFQDDYLKDIDDPEARAYLNEKTNEAKNLLNSLSMRHQAITKLVYYLTQKQRDFFLAGPLHLSPLSMHHAAEDLGVHPSTISRCAKGKYMDTPWGPYPFQFFFQSSAGNEDLPAEFTRTQIANLILAENKSHPISDQSIADSLLTLGISLSRRAVSKYREELGYPCQRERKRYD